MSRLLRSFLVALAFLTVVPIRFRVMPSAEEVTLSRFHYPLVGLVLGGILGVVAFLAGTCTPPAVAAFLTLAAWVTITGALHLDGFCDLCDGVFGGHTPEDRLRIMKDPHVGTFGLAGGVLLLLGKFVMLGELFRRPEDVALVLAISVAAARCTVLTLAAGARYPRPEGTGRLFVEGVSKGNGVCAALLAAGLIVIATTGNLPRALAMMALASLIILGLRLLCQRRLGGLTGDCLGAGIESVELVLLFAAVIAG